MLSTLCTLKSYWWKHRVTEQAPIQFSSVAQLCPTLCDPMNLSIPGLPVHHQLLESTQTHAIESVMPSNYPTISSSVIPFSSHPQSFPASGSFPIPMSQLFIWGDQSIRISASTSVLPVNTQEQSPLGWTGWSLATWVWEGRERLLHTQGQEGRPWGDTPRPR